MDVTSTTWQPAACACSSKLLISGALPTDLVAAGGVCADASPASPSSNARQRAGSAPGEIVPEISPRCGRYRAANDYAVTRGIFGWLSAGSRLALGWLSAGSRLHLEARADAPRGLEEDVRRGLACSVPKSTAVLHVSPLASSIQGVPAATSCHFVPSRAISCNLAPAATSAAHTTFPSLELKMSASPALSRCRSTCSRNLLAASFR